MLAMLGDRRIAVTGPRFGERIGAIATRAGDEGVAVVVYNCDDERPLAEGDDVQVTVHLRGLRFAGASAVLRHYRIDAEHCNSRGAWIAQGRPSEKDITKEQIAAIQRAQELQLLEPERPLTVQTGGVTLTLTMPTNSVSLLVLAAPGS
jgi:xylan 1,4-beta-xylosidase